MARGNKIEKAVAKVAQKDISTDKKKRESTHSNRTFTKF